MSRFIPREKMGKREKRTLDKAKRVVWEGVSPVTRTIENKKRYDRKRTPRRYDDDGTGLFFIVGLNSTLMIPPAFSL